jgi:DNA-3-methyladenine glycosylase
LLCKALGLKVPEWDAKRFDHELLLVEDVRPAPPRSFRPRAWASPKGVTNT